MKTFLISLARQTNRRKKLLSDLNRLGLNYEVFDAVDGYDLTEHEIHTYCAADSFSPKKPFFTKGLIGAGLSHYYVYQKIIEQGLPYAFVIEDDACLPNDIGMLLEYLEPNLNVNEVILLYYQNSGLVKLSGSVVLDPGSKARLANVVHGRLNGAGAYVITREACIAMCKAILPIHVGPDDWSYFLQNGLMGLRIVYPRLVRTYDFKSTVSDLANFSNNSLLVHAVSWVEMYRIFPFYQMLQVRRSYNKTLHKLDFSFMEPSGREFSK